MKFVADLHIHSHYSRATSKNLNFEQLTKWAQLKGVQVVGTGDIAHPGWLQEMKEKLEPVETGLFQLKAEHLAAVQTEVPPACQGEVRFMIGGEISSIYKKHNRTRKVHNIIFAPSFEVTEQIQAALEKIGNIRSDGRPILGLPSRDLLEIILEIDAENHLIPAHIWTPWFSLLGSKSGYDSVEECFQDLTPHIFALETGLSSDPPMNWQVSSLDKYTLISNSDAHSPPKLAREANLFDTELSYDAIFTALKTGDVDQFIGTLEFFPEEGKYHHDGHRKCEISWPPETTIAHNRLCSHCGKPVTVGVAHRVTELADRPATEKPARTHPFESLIPLPEVLSELLGVGPNSKRVQTQYHHLLSQLGPELTILRETPLGDIEQVGGAKLAEGIKRMRQGEVSTVAGYDGEFGLIKLFRPDESGWESPQLSFFAPPTGQKAVAQAVLSRPATQVNNVTSAVHQIKLSSIEPELQQPSSHFLDELNATQLEAVKTVDQSLIITAGPGTGKTRTLTHRIAYLVLEKAVSPTAILAITFTNKAATEMAERLTRLLGANLVAQLTIKTFHALGLLLLREFGSFINLAPNFTIAGDQDRLTLLKQVAPDLNRKAANEILTQISAVKNQLQLPDYFTEKADFDFASRYQAYQTYLQQNHILDFDDLILQTVQLLENHPDLQQQIQVRFPWISVDEYQDLNLAQYRLLQLLTAAGATNLSVIGDPDQAIYGFRGANRSYFLQFQADFPQAKHHHLSQNYRSTQLILEASGQVIEQDNSIERLKVWSNFFDQTKLDIHHAPTERAEAEYVVHQIEQMVGGTSYFSHDSGRVEDDSVGVRTFADFAILYRLGALSQPLIEALDRSGMPYQISGQTPFYDYAEIQLVLAGLWTLANPNSIFHLGKLLNAKSVLFEADQMARLATLLSDEGGSVGESLIKAAALKGFKRGSKRRLQEIASLLTLLTAKRPFPTVAETIGVMVDFWQTNQGINFDERQLLRLERLTLQAQPFERRLTEFLEMTLLQKEADLHDPRADQVTLMTLHAAKGLEFPVVFIVGCEEGILPYQRPNQPVDIAEERRLFYVGMTRSKQKLSLTRARTRFLFGQEMANPPSRFLADIEQRLTEIKAMAARKKPKEKPKPAGKQLKLF